MPNILVTGANGQLGSEIHEHTSNSKFKIQNSKFTFHFTDKDELNITDYHAIKNFCTENNINVIINCAAYTAVDKAEEDEISADKINHLAVKYLAEISKEKNITLIHISTDYVFDGTNYKPYIESDVTNPNGIYGQTKLNGEKAMQDINPNNSIIIRTSWVYSSYGANFVKTMLRLGKESDSLGVIFDQVGTPTYARDLAKAILEIIQNSKFKIQNSTSHTEIYNFSNEGVASWYDFAKEIMEQAKINCAIVPIESFEYPLPAPRPSYSVLNKRKIKDSFNLSIPYWKDSLKIALRQISNI